MLSSVPFSLYMLFASCNAFLETPRNIWTGLCALRPSLRCQRLRSLLPITEMTKEIERLKGTNGDLLNAQQLLKKDLNKVIRNFNEIKAYALDKGMVDEYMLKDLNKVIDDLKGIQEYIEEPINDLGLNMDEVWERE